MENREFNAKIRFAVMSDLHYSYVHPHTRERFKSAMNTVYDYCAKSDYKGLDALYIVGDFTDLGSKADMERLKEDCAAYVKPETETVITMANHELHYVADYRQAMIDFLEVFNMDYDRHLKIGGYHFISLSTTFDKGPWHDSFDEKKRTFLKNALEEARNDTGNKPIFVFQHVGMPGTLTGGISGNSDLYPILADYPQVIDFSGHSHRAVNHPKEIHQGDFTSVNTGGLLDIQVYSGYDNPNVGCGGCGAGDAAHMLLVEADGGNNVRIRKLDVIAGGFFENDIYIENPADKRNRRYTMQRAKNASAPYFKKTAEAHGVNKNGTVTVSFPAALCDGERVAEYNIVLLNSEGVVLRQKSISSEYFRLNQPTEYSAQFDNADGAASALIYANGFWDNLSEPLECGIEG